MSDVTQADSDLVDSILEALLVATEPSAFSVEECGKVIMRAVASYREAIAKEERESIIKYLRETACIHKSNIRGKDAAESRHHMNSCNWSAHAIERGEHHFPLPSSNSEK